MKTDRPRAISVRIAVTILAENCDFRIAMTLEMTIVLLSIHIKSVSRSSRIYIIRQISKYRMITITGWR